MPAFLDNLVWRAMLWSIRKSETGRVDSIGLASFRGHGDSFTKTIESALRLIKEQDPRRYARVKRHIAWVVNQVNSALGAQYQPKMRTLFLQFEEAPEVPPDVLIALYASTIVHEATHGVIEARGIEMSEANRLKIERLCVAEQNRFVAILRARDPERYPPCYLNFRADERYWAPEWEKSPAQRALSYIKRLRADGKAGAPAVMQVRINEEIEAPEVSVIGPDGNNCGVLPIAEALKMARGLRMDLVEVEPNTTPPVVRIVDFPVPGAASSGGSARRTTKVIDDEKIT